jgi:hypothetical protein
MKTKEEFAMGNEEKDYCVHCSRPDGTMQSYDEKLVSMSSFIVRTQGLDNSAAKKVAESMMSKLPAWKKS